MKLPSIVSLLFFTLVANLGCSRNPEPTLIAPTPLSSPATGGTTVTGDITVTTLDDISDFGGSQLVGDLPGPDGLVSFREAVTAANNTAGPQTIVFSIPTETFWLMPEMGLLRLEQGAFFINDAATTVDFSSQTFNEGDTNPAGPEIGIYGLEPNGWGIAAIYVNGNNCVVKGLGNVYQRGYAVRLVGNQNRVIGCQISGPLHASVGIEGYMDGTTPSGNIIGGTASGEGNFLTSVRIAGPADGNIVIGNIVLGGGILVQGAPQYGVIARNNRIGGPTAAERNVISGAGAYGEEGFPVGAQVEVVDADNTTVEGNYIGTTVDGMNAYSPQIGQYGVEVRDARNTTIRRNLIAGEHVFGTGHYTGKIFGQAIFVSAANFDTQATVIEENSIGVAVDGVTPILTRMGIVVSSLTTLHKVLGTVIDSNRIARIETVGVSVGPWESGVMITHNSIRDCGGLGIDLLSGMGTSGVTPNDPGDGDDGANGLQNFPVLQSAASGGGTITVEGSLSSLPFEQFTIEFFTSRSCDPSGFGEGCKFVGSAIVTTDGAGRASFARSMPGHVVDGGVMTATATRFSTRDTSEFSACVPVATENGRPTGGDVTITQ